jgi:hypothetical protein
MKILSSILLFLILNNIGFCQQNNYNKSLYNNILGINSEPVIYKEVSLSSYQLISANIQFSKNNNQQKIILSPYKMFVGKYNDYFSETVLNISQKSGITTLGIGFGRDFSAPYGSKANDILKRKDIGEIPSQRPQDKKTETNDEYNIYVKNYEDNLVKMIYTKFYEALTENSLKINAGYNIQLFEVIGGNNVDLNNNNLIDNFYTIKSHNINAGFTYNYQRKFGVEANVHYSQKRATPEEGQKIIPYYGGSFSFGIRIIDLNKDYKISEDYLKSLFIPSIGIGFSIEYQKCNGDLKYCEDNISEQFIVTPFLDFKINPRNQFRLGVPINNIKFIGSQNQILMGPFIQYCIQLSDLN